MARIRWPIAARRRWLAGLSGMVLAAGLSVGVSAAPAVAASATTVSVDGSSPGLTFDGDGAISGGGGNSRLLADYPEPQRSQVLDYLFKPGFGAQVQILKLETGGSGNSTSGAEPSFEETKGKIDCYVGYEFWLGEQAAQRNPNIKLYGLTWSAPAWVGSSFYNANGIQYVLDWLGCAKQHGLTISYVGGWNEHGYDAGWFPQLRTALNNNGYGSVQVVAADANDSGWSTADAMAGNTAFKQSAVALGNHYPCSPYTGSGSYTQCTSTATARGLGLPLWASENGSLDFQDGGAPMARTDNLVYLQGRMVANINWPIVASLYPDVSFRGQGLITADQPSSGAYTVGRSTWAMAHTTQFAQPGWKYLDNGSGYLGGSSYTQGSYVTLKSPNNRDWSTIIETTRASGAQTVTFGVSGGLSTGTLHVWSTNLSSSDPSTWFVKNQDVTPDSSGHATVTLQPDMAYSFTTTTGQGKGTATSPSAGDLPLPYSDDFSSSARSSQPRYLATMEGAFDIQPCVGRSGNCVQQETPARPLEWGGFNSDTRPYTAGGSVNWTNYQVSADVMNKVSGSAGIAARVQNAGEQQNNGEDPSKVKGYWFSLRDNGGWSITRSDFSDTVVTLASGTVSSAAGTGSWHHLSLSVSGASITGAIDGTTVGTVTDGSYSAGKVGLFTGGYTAGDQFANLDVKPLAGTSQTVTVPYSTTGSGTNQWQYSGSWSGGGGNTWSNTAGDTATLTFKGSYVALDSIVYDSQGVVSVSVDGGAATSVDLYRNSTQGVTAPVFTADGLDPSATHTLKVTVTGNKNSSSKGSWASIASAVVGTPQSVPYSTTGSGTNQWQYSGSWSSGGGNTWSNTAGDTATLTFKGGGATLDSIVYDSQGVVSVSVDGGAATSVDLYRNSPQGVTAPVFTVNNLDPSATHTLKVTVTGNKNSASKASWASIAGAQIT
ncbi:galactosylceramidase [Streptomyces sp. N50]|uniref:galactosylceramidase n=1 Tax=Streptomyces sp. N50 TaxID=3081765 RepID=UPI00296210BF|nr:galactosylceramidase [Streptomyces sp. N50]WOX07491.1 galactosylceramidase [Streptomyces sp. N50]